jgi:hypothetical protein
MVAAAGAVADGLICHPLLSRSYLVEVVVPAVRRSRAEHAREDSFEISALCMVATGRTEEAPADAVAGAAADRVLRLDAGVPTGPGPPRLGRPARRGARADQGRSTGRARRPGR